MDFDVDGHQLAVHRPEFDEQHGHIAVHVDLDRHQLAVHRLEFDEQFDHVAVDRDLDEHRFAVDRAQFDDELDRVAVDVHLDDRRFAVHRAVEHQQQPDFAVHRDVDGHQLAVHRPQLDRHQQHQPRQQHGGRDRRRGHLRSDDRHDFGSVVRDVQQRRLDDDQQQRRLGNRQHQRARHQVFPRELDRAGQPGDRARQRRDRPECDLEGGRQHRARCGVGIRPRDDAGVGHPPQRHRIDPVQHDGPDAARRGFGRRRNRQDVSPDHQRRGRHRATGCGDRAAARRRVAIVRGHGPEVFPREFDGGRLARRRRGIGRGGADVGRQRRQRRGHRQRRDRRPDRPWRRRDRAGGEFRAGRRDCARQRRDGTGRAVGRARRQCEGGQRGQRRAGFRRARQRNRCARAGRRGVRDVREQRGIGRRFADDGRRADELRCVRPEQPAIVGRRSEHRQPADHGPRGRQERHGRGERVAARLGREPADDADRPAHDQPRRPVHDEPERHERAAGLDRREFVGGWFGGGGIGLEQHGGRQQLARIRQRFHRLRRGLDGVG
nr:hypothetical protein [Burkholderia contaminans]